MAVASVIETIVKLTDAHEKLLQSGLEKKNAIIHRDLDALMRLMRLESRLSKEIIELDLARLAAARRLLVEKGVKSRLYVSYRNLMGVVFDPEERTQLQQVHERLGKTLNELKSLNQLNQTLLQHSLDFIQFSIEMFIMPEDESYTYKNPSLTTGDYNRTGLYNSKA